jgi:WS/DGAT/MGAT family acyltransferase
MAHPHYERLSPLDAALLAVEDHDVHMHMGGLSIFEAGPLWRPGKGLDIDRIREYVVSRLHLIPRYRQRLARTPIERHPIWLDDRRFNVNYHVRHTSLPLSAGERELKRLAGRILSQQLDRGKPLWEMWFVEGCGEGRFALVTKIHHCMVDGVGGVGLLRYLMSDSPDPSVEARPPWIARPGPGRGRLLLDTALHPASEVLKDARRALAAPRETLAALGDTAAGLRDAIGANLQLAPRTPINVPIGPHRRLDWLRMDLDAVKEVKNRLGGTVNDVALAVVAGAIRRFFERRRISPAGLDFRALVPVSTRPRNAEPRSFGNQVSQLVAPLPVDESDPVRRLERVVETTQELKASRLPRVTGALEKVSNWTFPGFYAALVRQASHLRSHNLLVTNVPGPREPAYMLGARQAEVYPAVPLFANQDVAIGLFSYETSLFWGFNSDWDSVPDLHDLVEAVESEFALLRERATRARTAEDRPRRRAPRRAKRRGAQSAPGAGGPIPPSPDLQG